MFTRGEAFTASRGKVREAEHLLGTRPTLASHKSFGPGLPSCERWVKGGRKIGLVFPEGPENIQEASGIFSEMKETKTKTGWVWEGATLFCPWCWLGESHAGVGGAGASGVCPRVLGSGICPRVLGSGRWSGENWRTEQAVCP